MWPEIATVTLAKEMPTMDREKLDDFIRFLHRNLSVLLYHRDGLKEYRKLASKVETISNHIAH